MQGQGRDFSIFIIQQSNRFRFNKGMLLNVGVSLLRRSDYDYFVFHDVDLTPSEIGQVPYDYPFGTSLSSFHISKPLEKFSPYRCADHHNWLSQSAASPNVGLSSFLNILATSTVSM